MFTDEYNEPKKNNNVEKEVDKSVSVQEKDEKEEEVDVFEVGDDGWIDISPDD